MLLPRYSPVKISFSDEQKVLSNQFNPVNVMYKDTFDAIPNDILRWRVTARPSTSKIPKAVLRQHLTRRWKNAFADALRRRGYELDGRKAVEGKKVPGLQGTLEIPIYDGKGLENPYEELLNAAEVAVDSLEKLQEQASARDTSKQRTVKQPMGPKQEKRQAARVDQSQAGLQETKLGG